MAGVIVGALGCLVAAAPASAAEIFLKTDVMYNPGTVKISGPGVNVTAYAAPVIFVADNGVGSSKTTFDIVAFCVDIFHEIPVGINKPETVDLQYHTSTLTQNGNGLALSAKQISEIGGLVDFGTRLFDAGGSNPKLSDELAGVQGAIWAIEDPSYKITSSNSKIQAYIGEYVTEAAHMHGKITTIYADNHLTQGFAVGSVPEPSVWAMMLVGVGLIGFQLRSKAKSRATELAES